MAGQDAALLFKYPLQVARAVGVADCDCPVCQEAQRTGHYADDSHEVFELGGVRCASFDEMVAAMAETDGDVITLEAAGRHRRAGRGAGWRVTLPDTRPLSYSWAVFGIGGCRMRTNPYWLTVPGDRMLDAMHLAERLYLKAYTLVVQAPPGRSGAQGLYQLSKPADQLRRRARLGYGLRSVWGPGRVRLDVATELIMSQAEHLLLVDKARIARELTEPQMGEGDKVRA